MSKLYRSDGSFFSIIPPKTYISPQSSSFKSPLNLVGDYTVNYDRLYNDNFLHLTENFCSYQEPLNIQGQLWARPHDSESVASGDYGFELFISSRDDSTLSNGFYTVPVISLLQNEPQVSDSSPGRMYIENGTSLKILIGNKWKTIPTSISGTKFSSFSVSNEVIRYNPVSYNDPLDCGAIVNIINPGYDQQSPDSTETISSEVLHVVGTDFINVARINPGGEYNETLERVVSSDVGGKILKFGSTYKCKIQITISQIPQTSGHIDGSPAGTDVDYRLKTWNLYTTIHVSKNSEQAQDIQTYITNNPGIPWNDLYISTDPRILSSAFSGSLSFKKDVVYQDEGCEGWDVNLKPQLNFPLLSDVSVSGSVDVERFILNGDLYGFMIQFKNSNNTTYTDVRASVKIDFQGIENVLSE